MSLFRNIRSDGDDHTISAPIEVAYHDSKSLTWITWPRKRLKTADQENNIAPEIACSTEIARTLKQTLINLIQRKSTHEVGTAKNEQPSKLFSFYRLPPNSSTQEQTAALIPEPPSLSALALLTPDLERAGITTLKFREFVVLSMIRRQAAFASGKPVAGNTVLFGFERRHLLVTGVNVAWQEFVESKLRRSLDFENAAGSATFQQIIQRLDLHLFSDVSEVVGREIRHVSGASFDVTVARAKEKSTLEPHHDGSPRQQWNLGSVLVLKRPRFQSNPDRSGFDCSQASGTRAMNQSARVERSIINELQILSHGPLREHQNIIHLYGIAWDRTNAGSIYDATPILIQPFADHGQLDAYLTYLSQTSGVTSLLKANILKQILIGLRDLHACRIIHGDLKPSNILVQSSSSSENPRIMLSDFGFSLMPSPGQQEVEIAGQTREFAAPEVSRCIEEGSNSLFTEEAFESDIYSFGMTAFSVVFPGVNLFDMINRVWVEGMPDTLPPLPRTSSAARMTPEQLQEEVKRNSDSDDWFFPRVHSLLHLETQRSERENPGERTIMWTWIALALTWSPKERISITEMLHLLEKFAAFPPSPSTDQSIGSPSHQLGQLMQQFFIIDGELLEFAMKEVSLEERLHVDLLGQNYQIKAQIFQDLAFKASVLVENPVANWPALRENRGLQKWTASVYAAYQVFLCFLHGFGTKQDLSLAGRYLAASACGGYTQALTTCFRFHQRYPDIYLPGWEPSSKSIHQVVSMGLFSGIRYFHMDLRVLKELDPDSAADIWAQVNEFAFSELGEDGFDLTIYNETSYPGPDINFLWYPEGSMALVGRLVSQCNANQLIDGCKFGLFPEDGTNDNGETLLYMCCRTGNAEVVLALFEEFEWIPQQTTKPARNGRLPLHFLFAFPPEDVPLVGEVLLAHGADINSQDKNSWRAVDAAISADRGDVVFWLLEHHGPLFGQPQLMDADLVTADLAAAVGSADVMQRCIRSATLETKMKILLGIARVPVERRILEGRPENLDSLLGSIGEIPRIEDTSLQERIRETMILASLNGNTDVLSRVSECLLPSVTLSNKSLVYVLTSAAVNGHLEDVKIVLSIPASWTLVDAHDILSTVVEVCPGPNQRAIVQVLLQCFEELDIVTDVVNLVPTGCEPNCSLHSGHSYHTSIFASAILNEHYDVATVLNDYVVHDNGYPNALYHVLNKPSAKTLEHINELITNQGDAHWAYMCYPIYNRTALQVVAKENKSFKSPEEVTNVLHMLLEYYIDAGEDIDAKDSFGHTALFYAADFACPEAIQVLLEYGADALLEQGTRAFTHVTHDLLWSGSGFVANRQRTATTHTAYTFVLYQIYHGFRMGELTGSKLDRSRFSIPSVPVQKDHDSARREEFVKQFETLAALSFQVDNGSELPGEFAAAEVAGGALSEWKVAGLVPRTTNARVEIEVTEDGTPQLNIWGVFKDKGLEFSMWIGLTDDMSSEEIERRRDQHKAKYIKGDPECPVHYAMTGFDGKGHLYLYLVQRLPDDQVDDTSQPPFGSDDAEIDPDFLENMKNATSRLGVDLDLKGKGKAKPSTQSGVLSEEQQIVDPVFLRNLQSAFRNLNVDVEPAARLKGKDKA